ncbi:MAG: peptide chain release factor N(5)-glutamine methyltransferase [Rectinema sp.]
MNYRELILNESSSFSDSDSPFLDAVLLMAHSLGITKEKLFSMLSERVDSVPQSFFDMTERRRNGESIAHIRGFREFYGREFLVNSDVLSPRQDTEVLVEAVLESSKLFEPSAGINGSLDVVREISILDLCTGCGAVAISLAAEMPNHKVTASDISSAALDLAKKNAQRLLPAQSLIFIESDLFSEIDGKFEIIAANPPYVPHYQAEQLIAKGWKDPLISLDGGIDGMEYIRKIIMEGYEYLSHNGVLLLEMDPYQASESLALFGEMGYIDLKTWKDLTGSIRVVGGRHG